MNLWIDVEFNSYQGSLLSLGIVSERTDAWYWELPLDKNEPLDPWVRDNVIPHMYVIKELATLTERQAVISEGQSSLEKWLSTFDTVHLIADWPDDIRHFCDFLITGPGTRIKTPPLTMEIRRDIDSSQSEVPHNALHDAQAIRDAYLKLDK